MPSGVNVAHARDENAKRYLLMAVEG